MVCTRTLYNYVDRGLIGIRNADLPEKLKRNTKSKYIRRNKKKLGLGIEERPKERDWECDLVLGHKTKDDEVLLTLCERMSHEFLIIRIPDKTSASVMQALRICMKTTKSIGMISSKQLLLTMDQNLRTFLILRKFLRL